MVLRAKFFKTAAVFLATGMLVALVGASVAECTSEGDMVETVPTVTAEQSVTEKKAPPLNPDPDLMVNAEGDQVALKNAKEIGRQWVDQNGATDE